MAATKKLSVAHRFRIAAMVVPFGLSAAACTGCSTLLTSETDVCEVLFERAYPGEGQRYAWVSGRDAPPEDWDAYREGEKRGCEWLIER